MSDTKTAEKIFQRNFEKPLDKLSNLWYNKYRKKRTRTLKNEKGNKNMSTATLYSVPSLLKAVINGENNEAMRESAQKLLEAYQKQNEKRNSKAAEKRAAENAPFVEAVTNLLRSNSKVWTATEVKDAIEGIESTSKATAILKMVEGIKVSEVAVNRRIVKGYSL